MSLAEMYLLPWILVVPYGVYYLINVNYRKNSGRCLKCGIHMEAAGEDSASRQLDIGDSHEGYTCSQCRSERRERGVLVNVLGFLCIAWVLSSLFVFRRVAMGIW